MDNNFVHRTNLAHFQKLIDEATDETRRQLLLKLLAEEQAKAQPAPE